MSDIKEILHSALNKAIGTHEFSDNLAYGLMKEFNQDGSALDAIIEKCTKRFFDDLTKDKSYIITEFGLLGMIREKIEKEVASEVRKQINGMDLDSLVKEVLFKKFKNE